MLVCKGLLISRLLIGSRCVLQGLPYLTVKLGHVLLVLDLLLLNLVLEGVHGQLHVIHVGEQLGPVLVVGARNVPEGALVVPPQVVLVDKQRV